MSPHPATEEGGGPSTKKNWAFGIESLETPGLGE